MKNDEPENLFEIAPETEEIDPFVDPPVIPQGANASTVIAVADKTAKSIEAAKSALKGKVKSLPGLDKVVEILMHDKELLDTGEPPSLSAVRNDEAYTPILDELQAIVNKYKKGFDSTTADEDITRMAAYLTDLSQELAIFQAQAQDARAREERVKSIAYVKAKKAAIAENARLSDVDAKELSKYMGLAMAERAANLEFIEKYLYNSFHSIRNFVEVLNFVTGRRRRMDETGAQL